MLGCARLAAASPRGTQVIDGEAGWSAEEESIMAALAPSKSRPLPLLVVNKADRAPNAAQALPDGVVARFAAVSTTSAARGEGIAQLEEAVADVLGVSRTAPEGAAWAANQRQVRPHSCVQVCCSRLTVGGVADTQAEALELARAALIRLEETVRQDLPVDFWTIELREAALALGLVTGADVSDDVLATIFARFCIGK
jgi:tRNA modification GTPase